MDDNNILWNTMQISSSKTQDTFVAKVSEVRTWIRRDKSAHGPSAKTSPPAPDLLRETLPADLRHPIEEHNLSAPSSCHHAAFRLPGSAYQRKVPETNDDDSDLTAP